MVEAEAPRPARGAALERLPLLALAALSLIAGLWGGLLRVGVALPIPTGAVIADHGALMVCGFLGTLIAVERAVGLGRRWAYAAPVLTGAGSVSLLVGAPFWLASLAVVLGSGIFLAASLGVMARQRAIFTLTPALGALAWVVGNLQWCLGLPIFQLVLWWAAFLLWTIAGERLELSRVRRPPRSARLGFCSVAALLGVGLVVLHWNAGLGSQLSGAGLLAFALWLARYDLARRSVRQRGLPRFIAICLLSGFLWLGLSGALLIHFGPLAPGLPYDAILHAFFLGFVLSMIFGHAPIIFPAVLRVPIVYHPLLYLPLVVLHASVALRLAADLGDLLGLREWAGALHVVSIVLYAGTLLLTNRRGCPSIKATPTSSE